MKKGELFIVFNDSLESREMLKRAIVEALEVSKEMPCAVYIEPYKKDRTALQNNYLNGYIFRNQIMEKLNAAGITMDGGVPFCVDSLKIIFKIPYFADQIEDPSYFMLNDKEYRKEFHPSKLSSKLFGKYCDLVCDAAALRWGIHVEPPISGRWLSIYRELK